MIQTLRSYETGNPELQIAQRGPLRSKGPYCAVCSRTPRPHNVSPRSTSQPKIRPAKVLLSGSNGPELAHQGNARQWLPRGIRAGGANARPDLRVLNRGISRCSVPRPASSILQVKHCF